MKSDNWGLYMFESVFLIESHNTVLGSQNFSLQKVWRIVSHWSAILFVSSRHVQFARFPVRTTSSSTSCGWEGKVCKRHAKKSVNIHKSIYFYKDKFVCTSSTRPIPSDYLLYELQSLYFSVIIPYAIFAFKFHIALHQYLTDWLMNITLDGLVVLVTDCHLSYLLSATCHCLGLLSCHCLGLLSLPMSLYRASVIIDNNFEFIHFIIRLA